MHISYKQVLINLLIIYFIVPQQPVLAHKTSIESPVAVTIPSIDGMITKGEWDDATKLDISTEAYLDTRRVAYTIYFYIKHDGSNFYFALDVSGINSPDSAQLDFDWKNDADMDGVHDTGYSLGTYHGFEGLRLTTEGGYPFDSRGEGEYTVETRRSQFELKVPHEEIYFTGEVIGLWVALLRSKEEGLSFTYVVGWPKGSSPVDPTTWADLRVKPLATRFYDPSTTLTYTDLSKVVVRLVDLYENAVVGRDVAFDYWNGKNWISLGTGITDAEGYATVSYTPLMKPDNYKIRASFTGDGLYEAASNDGELIILKETVKAVITMPESIEVGENATIQISITDDEESPVPDLLAQIYINENIINEANVDKRGKLFVDWTPYEAGEYTIEVRTVGGDYYQDFITKKSVTATKAAIPFLLVVGLAVGIMATITLLLLLKKFRYVFSFTILETWF